MRCMDQGHSNSEILSRAIWRAGRRLFRGAGGRDDNLSFRRRSIAIRCIVSGCMRIHQYSCDPVGARVCCIDRCYHDYCFYLLNVISNGMYQYKHCVFHFCIYRCCCCCCCCCSQIKLLFIHHPRFQKQLSMDAFFLSFISIRRLLKQRMIVFPNPLVCQFFCSYFSLISSGQSIKPGQCLPIKTKPDTRHKMRLVRV